jgi:hypothetical protein
MSMICFTKAEREQHTAKVLNLCWEGQVKEGITYVTHLDRIRHQAKHQELVSYLTKHQTEIINYQRRQCSGKTIGSGTSESAVNQVVGRRQKHNGMSWSSTGSQALALLTTVELNHAWETIWTFYNKTPT